MPSKKENENLYYSFDINNVHFVSITSDFIFRNYRGSDYLSHFQDWLRKDLANSNLQWKVVYMHRPLYCSWDNERCKSEGKKLRDFLENIFYDSGEGKVKVDIVLSGHNHNYERMFPIYENNIDYDSISSDGNTYKNPKYPVYTICGSTGNKEGHVPLYEPKPITKMVSDKTGICDLTFSKSSMELKFLADDGSVLDIFKILKGTDGSNLK